MQQTNSLEKNLQNTGTLPLAKALIAIPSITPEDKGCQQLIAERLAALGFSIEHLRFGDVDNLWARYGAKGPLNSESPIDSESPLNSEGPLFVFAGHTDVVPTGPLAEWESPPFQPTIRSGYLYGRGAADMKSSLAAMVTACERFLKQSPTLRGSIAFLITSDEEGPAKDGTKKVLETLQERGVIIDYCVVGEPSSEEKLGDIVKVGRRGSLSGFLKIFGKQNHIAYATQEDNPIHQSFAALSELANMVWDPLDKDEANTVNQSIVNPCTVNPSDAAEAAKAAVETDETAKKSQLNTNDDIGFPITSFHISNLHAGTHAGNVVPGILECQFNFRFSPKLTPEIIQEKVESIFKAHKLRYELRWDLSGLPFLTKKGKLRQVVSAAITEQLGISPEPSSMGGTSDARFIAQTGAEVIEFGPSRKSIHSINECVKVEDLDKLSLIYEGILQKLLRE